jgi:diacylglycerol O-acyltransferase
MTVTRLNPTDEMLYGAERTLGSSRIIQVLWRFPAEVPASALWDEWVRLNRGRLSRRVAPATVPGARRRWVPASNAVPPREDTEPLTDETVMDWIDRQAREPLPAGSAALWRLARAPYRDGSLVSLTVPHFRCDGLGVFAALAAADAGDTDPGLLDGDVEDLTGQAARALATSPGWALRLATDRRARRELREALRGGPAPAGASAGSEPRFFSTAIVAVDAAAWEIRAKAYGGTVNSLFVEIAANLVRARVPGRASIDVGIPMSLRESAADARANALVVVPLELPAGPVWHGDLGPTRQATRDLLSRSGEQSATLVPEPLWHLLPEGVAHRLKAPGAQQTDVVASNFGRVPDAVAEFTGQKADGVALRTVNVPGLVPEKARLRASLCLLQVADRMMVTVTGMPDHFGDAAALHALVREELAAWGLTGERWCG